MKYIIIPIWRFLLLICWLIGTIFKLFALLVANVFIFLWVFNYKDIIKLKRSYFHFIISEVIYIDKTVIKKYKTPLDLCWGRVTIDMINKNMSSSYIK